MPLFLLKKIMNKKTKKLLFTCLYSTALELYVGIWRPSV